MADAADIFALMGGAPSAPQQAQALAEALRRRQETANLQRGAGNLGLLTGDRVLSNFGQAQLQQANQLGDDIARQEGLIAQAGGQGAGRALQAALAERQQAFQGQQAGLNRAAQRDLAGIVDARERDKMKAAEGKAAAKEEADKAKALQEGATGLRKEFNANPEVKDYQMLSGAFDKLQTVSKTPGRAADLAMIFSFMQMLDPGVSVMEGDVQNVKNSSGQMDNAINTYKRVFDGETLSPVGRKSIMEQANALHGTARRRYDSLAKSYSDLAERSGFSRGDVIFAPPSGLETPQAPAARSVAPVAPGSMNLEAPQAGQGAPAVDVSAAEAWLRNNPNSPAAASVRQRLKEMKGQ